jgi:hypothetical protein
MLYAIVVYFLLDNGQKQRVELLHLDSTLDKCEQVALVINQGNTKSETKCEQRKE